jgi:hypothetical protein
MVTHNAVISGRNSFLIEPSPTALSSDCQGIYKRMAGIFMGVKGIEKDEVS